MGKLENGGSEGRDALDGAATRNKTSSQFQSAPQRALLKSAVLTVFCFLIHILVLLLVDPLRVLPLSKEEAYLYAAIPLCFGALYLILSVYNFIRIEERHGFHILLLLVALSFGSMSLQGLLGLALHYVKPWMESA